MPQTWTGSYEYQRPWGLITRAIFSKYPNPFAGHVLYADTLDRFVGEDGKLYTSRLLVKTNQMPKWGLALFHVSPHGYILESSVVDPKTKTMTTVTRNITHTTIMVVEETQVIRPAATSPDLTEILTTAEVTCNLQTGGQFLRNRVEAFGAQRFDKNIKKTRNGMNWVLDNLDKADNEARERDNASQLSSASGRPRNPLIRGLADRVERAKERVGEKVERAAEKVNERVDKVLPSVAEPAHR